MQKSLLLKPKQVEIYAKGNQTSVLKNLNHPNYLRLSLLKETIDNMCPQQKELGELLQTENQADYNR